MRLKIIILLFCITSLSVSFFIPNAFAENVPAWIKNNAGWWANGQIDDSSFVSGIQWLISNDVMIIPPTEQRVTSESDIIPAWIKNTAGWWADDKISEVEFINGIQFLIKNGVITISDSLNEKYGLCDTDHELSVQFREKIKVEVKEDWRGLCSNFYNEDYRHLPGMPSDGDGANINEHGFRGPEIAKEKPANTFRIFLIGSSTMFGAGSDDETQISSVLQDKFAENDFDFNIEVINAGAFGAWSKNEVLLVKNKLMDFNPDLIVVYDGVAERYGKQGENEISWKNRWSEICNLGKQNGFDTVIILQPFLESGLSSFTSHDYKTFAKHGFSVQLDWYPLYSKQLEALSKNCAKAVDMTHIFDRILGDLFFDNAHTGIRANQIIADNFYQEIIPLILPISSETVASNPNSKNDVIGLLSLENLEFDNVNFEHMDLSGVDFSGRNLANAVFYNTNLENTIFKNANLAGANFAGAHTNGANFSSAKIEGAKFIKTVLGDANFNNAVLDQAVFFGLDFTNSNLSGVSINDAKILSSSFKDMDLNGIDFTNTDFLNVDLSYSNMDDIDLSGKSLIHSNLTGVNLEGKNLEETDLTNAVLVDTNITDIQRSSAVFAGSNDYKPILTREQYGTTILMQSESIFEEEICDPILQSASNSNLINWVNACDGLKLKEGLQDLYNEIGITTEPQNTVVLFPTITLDAYSKRCVWDYYFTPMPDSLRDCYTVTMSNIDFTKPHPSNFKTFDTRNCFEGYDPNAQGPGTFCEDMLSMHLIYNSGFYGAEALDLLGYTIISDIEIEKNPSILSNYEKIIVLHNKYVTETIFNAITNHPNVVYLYPDALKEEVSIDFAQNTITALSPLKHPDDKNYQNDFQWEYDNSHREFVRCVDVNLKFENVDNGIMINCYPTDFEYYPALFKLIKGF